MHRDIDLIRSILFQVERKVTPIGWIKIEVDGYSKDQISYHVKLLAQGGYLEAEDLTTKDGFDWNPISLTWLGHEFLDMARNDTIWSRTKESIGNKIESVSMEFIKSLLGNIVKQMLEI